MALMMAAFASQRFRAVSSWCPITNLCEWHGQNPKYAPNIVACCGGLPGASPEIDREYRDRSPMSHLDALIAANLSVHHGRWDASVPYTHTWKLAKELEDRQAKRLFFEIFDGGHEIHYDRAFRWFDAMFASNSSESLTG